uniref:Uncharacterized protein n=1 Tax=Cacopsylla melanoneura TaxID=428564 RepID=A0A8D9AHH2_9HEMI
MLMVQLFGIMFQRTKVIQTNSRVEWSNTLFPRTLYPGQQATSWQPEVTALLPYMRVMVVYTGYSTILRHITRKENLRWPALAPADKLSPSVAMTTSNCSPGPPASLCGKRSPTR